MKYFEFGQEHPELMVMLHGGGGYVYLARHRQLHGKEAGETRQSVAGRGYAFTYKVFPNMGHGTLAGEHPEQFSNEVQAAHQCSLQKEKR